MPINARQVLQANARHWFARAELLERVETSFAAHYSDSPQDDQRMNRPDISIVLLFVGAPAAYLLMRCMETRDP